MKTFVMHVLQRRRNTVCWNVSSHKEKHEKQYSRCSAACARIHFNGFAFLHTPGSRVESHPRQGDESRGRAELLHFTFRSRAENRSRATHRGPGFRTAQPVVQLIHHRRPQPDLPRRGIRHFHLPDVEHRGTS